MSLKKIILISVIVLVFSSCQSISNENIAPGYKDTFISIKSAVFGYESVISDDLINQIPYASMLLRIGKGPEGLVILESIKSQEYTWVSADGVYLVTENGRIIKTSGLLNNLKSIDKGFSSLNEIINLSSPITVYYNFSNPELRNLKLVLEYSLEGQEELMIMGQKKELTLIYENGFSPTLGWKFINKYWVDENFIVWKSIQHVTPKIPPIEMLLTKKPS